MLRRGSTRDDVVFHLHTESLYIQWEDQRLTRVSPQRMLFSIVRSTENYIEPTKN